MFFKQAIIDKLITIVTEAGDIIKKDYFNTIEFIHKKDSTPLTKTDINVHSFLVEQLKQLTPEVPIMSEESSYIAFKDRKSWDEYWLIDPIDGTRGFIDKTDDFCVCIAYIKNNQPIFGMIFVPIRKTCYFANDDETAYKLQGVSLNRFMSRNPKNCFALWWVDILCPDQPLSNI